MTFDSRGLTFAPTLPPGWGDVTLSGVPYRDAVLTITLRGTGNIIRSFNLDGTPSTEHRVPTSLHGHHTIDITLDPSQT